MNLSLEQSSNNFIFKIIVRVTHYIFYILSNMKTIVFSFFFFVNKEAFNGNIIVLRKFIMTIMWWETGKFRTWSEVKQIDWIENVLYVEKHWKPNAWWKEIIKTERNRYILFISHCIHNNDDNFFPVFHYLFHNFLCKNYLYK